MKAALFTILLLLFFSCNKKTSAENNFENIDVYNEQQINYFLQSFFNNLNAKEDILSEINRAQFCGNILSKSSELSSSEKWLISKKQVDSLFTKEDLAFIREQVSDKKKYVIYQKNLKQKILNSDSLREENLRFNDWQNKKSDSLKLKDMQKFKEYISHEMFTENHINSKTYTPIIYFNKPVFLKNKNKVIFSHYLYSGFLSARQETALYEFKNGKWHKISILTTSIS